MGKQLHMGAPKEPQRGPFSDPQERTSNLGGFTAPGLLLTLLHKGNATGKEGAWVTRRSR